MNEIVARGVHDLGRGLRAGLERFRSVWTLSVLILATVALVVPQDFTSVAAFAANALAATLPYIAIAVALIAYLKAASADAVIARAFQGREVQMILMAAALGAFAPFCSCQVIPFIAGLLALGAPLSAVMAFWLSSPLIDPPQLMITAGALGWDFAIGKALAALALGVIGGFAVWALVGLGAFADPLRPRQSGGCCAKNPVTRDSRPVWRFWRDEPARWAVFRSEARENALFLLKWLSFAYVLEALLVHYAPADMIASVVGGDGFGAIAIAALVGAPAYLNGYAAPPLVAGLMEQGMSPGAAMAFMIGGSVSSIPAMAAVYSLVKPPVFLAYLVFGVVGAMLLGSVFAAVV